MSRFTRRPCEVCKEDTLHYVAKCNVCGNMVSLKSPFVVAHERACARAVKLAGEDKYRAGAILAKRQMIMAGTRRNRMAENGYDFSTLPVGKRKVG